MKKALSGFFFLLVLSLTLSPATTVKRKKNTPPAGNALYCNPAVVDQFWHMWFMTNGGMAANGTQEAGFRIDWVNNHLEIGDIVMGDDPLHCTIPINKHSIAVAHIHPSGGITPPSDKDMSNFLPDYVVARDGLWITVPNQHRFRHLRHYPDVFKVEGCQLTPDTYVPPPPKKHWWSF